MSIAISSGLELDILRVVLRVTYLKISGVLGLGGGSAAYGTFKRNEGGQGNKARRRGENRLLVVIRAFFQARKIEECISGCIRTLSREGAPQTWTGHWKITPPTSSLCTGFTSTAMVFGQTFSWRSLAVTEQHGITKVLLTWSSVFFLGCFPTVLFYN